MLHPRESFYPTNPSYFRLDNEFDFRPLFEEVKPLIDPYDLDFSNHESILGGKEISLSDFFVSNERRKDI